MQGSIRESGVLDVSGSIHSGVTIPQALSFAARQAANDAQVHTQRQCEMFYRHYLIRVFGEEQENAGWGGGRDRAKRLAYLVLNSSPHKFTRTTRGSLLASILAAIEKERPDADLAAIGADMTSKLPTYAREFRTISTSTDHMVKWNYKWMARLEAEDFERLDARRQSSTEDTLPPAGGDPQHAQQEIFGNANTADGEGQRSGTDNHDLQGTGQPIVQGASDVQSAPATDTGSREKVSPRLLKFPKPMPKKRKVELLQTLKYELGNTRRRNLKRMDELILVAFLIKPYRTYTREEALQASKDIAIKRQNQQLSMLEKPQGKYNPNLPPGKRRLRKNGGTYRESTMLEVSTDIRPNKVGQFRKRGRKKPADSVAKEEESEEHVVPYPLRASLYTLMPLESFRFKYMTIDTKGLLYLMGGSTRADMSRQAFVNPVHRMEHWRRYIKLLNRLWREQRGKKKFACLIGTDGFGVSVYLTIHIGDSQQLSTETHTGDSQQLSTEKHMGNSQQLSTENNDDIGDSMDVSATEVQSQEDHALSADEGAYDSPMEMPQIEKSLNALLLDPDCRTIGIDLGRKDIATCVSDGAWRKHFSNKRYYTEIGNNSRKAFVENELKRLGLYDWVSAAPSGKGPGIRNMVQRLAYWCTGEALNEEFPQRLEATSNRPSNPPLDQPSNPPSAASFDLPNAEPRAASENLSKYISLWCKDSMLQLKWKSYFLKKRTVLRFCQEILKDGDPRKTIVFVGNANFRHNSKGYPSSPKARVFIRCLMQLGAHVVSVDEFNTSQVCSVCRTTERLQDGHGRAKHPHYVKVCTNESCRIVWNRDINAARNIREVGIFLLLRRVRPERLKHWLGPRKSRATAQVSCQTSMAQQVLASDNNPVQGSNPSPSMPMEATVPSGGHTGAPGISEGNNAMCTTTSIRSVTEMELDDYAPLPPPRHSNHTLNPRIGFSFFQPTIPTLPQQPAVPQVRPSLAPQERSPLTPQRSTPRPRRT